MTTTTRGFTWSKIAASSRSHTGKWHAWGPLGGVCPSSSNESPSRFQRQQPPHRACTYCLRTAFRVAA